jgi:hypothetical protein
MIARPEFTGDSATITAFVRVVLTAIAEDTAWARRQRLPELAMRRLGNPGVQTYMRLRLRLTDGSCRVVERTILGQT